jgi:hypothetical protein
LQRRAQLRSWCPPCVAPSRLSGSPNPERIVKTPDQEQRFTNYATDISRPPSASSTRSVAIRVVPITSCTGSLITGFRVTRLVRLGVSSSVRCWRCLARDGRTATRIQRGLGACPLTADGPVAVRRGGTNGWSGNCFPGPKSASGLRAGSRAAVRREPSAGPRTQPRVMDEGVPARGSRRGWHLRPSGGPAGVPGAI